MLYREFLIKKNIKKKLAEYGTWKLLKIGGLPDNATILAQSARPFLPLVTGYPSLTNEKKDPWLESWEKDPTFRFNKNK